MKKKAWKMDTLGIAVLRSRSADTVVVVKTQDAFGHMTGSLLLRVSLKQCLV